MGRIQVELTTLLSICELKAIRENKGHMTIVRDPEGWTISMDKEMVIGKTLKEALENTIIPVKQKVKYLDWRPEGQSSLWP